MKKLKIAVIVLLAIGLVISFELGYLYIPLLPPQNLTDVEIKLERTPCYGPCPVYSVTVYGDGTVIYEGIRHVRIEGVQTYDISEDEVNDLVSMFYEINYFSLNDRYDAPFTDSYTIITSVKIGDETKTVSNYGDSGPPRLHELEVKIDEITNSESFWKD